jgi:hypothetical protein
MNLYTQAAEQRLESAINSTLLGVNNTTAIIFNLSQLGVKRDNNDHINIAANILRDQLKSSLGEIYVLKDGDLVLVLKSGTQKQIIESIYQIRYLFADDSLAYTNGIENSDFCLLYDSANNWDSFLEYCKSKIENVANDNSFVNFRNAKNKTTSLLSIISSQIEDALMGIDWGQVINVTPITTNPDSANYLKVIDNVSFDADILRTFLGHNRDMITNANLFAYVREFVEIRILIKVLNLIAAGHNSALLFKLSLNILRGEEFRIFKEALTEDKKKNLIIGIHISDVYKSLADFFELKKSLSQQGFKLCLCGLDNISFLNVDRQMLGFDLMKLKWEPSILKQSYDDNMQALKTKIQVSGSSRVILSNCESVKALEIGRKLGLNLYQGNYIANSL